MNVVDVIIIALLILGGVAGFKAGVIKKLTDFIGMFVIVNSIVDIQLSLVLKDCGYNMWFLSITFL